VPRDLGSVNNREKRINGCVFQSLAGSAVMPPSSKTFGAGSILGVP